MSNTADILKEMKNLTLLSGKISSVQVENLKLFPFIFFDKVESIKIDYDFKKNDPQNFKPKVKYYLEIKDLQDISEIAELTKRCSALESSVRTLFWSNTEVMIYIQDKLVFESK